MYKLVVIKLVYNLIFLKWKDGGNGEVVILDEEVFVDIEVRFGVFLGY